MHPRGNAPEIPVPFVTNPSPRPGVPRRVKRLPAQRRPFAVDAGRFRRCVGERIRATPGIRPSDPGSARRNVPARSRDAPRRVGRRLVRHRANTWEDEAIARCIWRIPRRSASRHSGSGRYSLSGGPGHAPGQPVRLDRETAGRVCASGDLFGFDAHVPFWHRKKELLAHR